MAKVERAIIMAAGVGKRMKPVTNNIPKPLISVNGVRMIDSIIDALNENGIVELYIVVGYLKEQFVSLTQKYKDITLIENPLFDTCNNISSLYYARDYLENSIILDGDQLIVNSSVLSPEIKKSGYNGVWTTEETHEWLMQLDGNRVVSCNKNGGRKGWILYSISRWTAEDGRKLKRYLEYEFDVNHAWDIYWDDITMFLHFDDFDLGIYPMKRADVIEIDEYRELCLYDKTYANKDRTNKQK